jgi:hypothetical protein
MLTSLEYKWVNKQTNTLSPSPKGFQSPKFSDSDSDVRKALAKSAQIKIFSTFLSIEFEYVRPILLIMLVEKDQQVLQMGKTERYCL